MALCDFKAQKSNADADLEMFMAKCERVLSHLSALKDHSMTPDYLTVRVI